jgi:hypothetical protein
MKNNDTIYKNVPLTGIRTKEMIDIIIEKRNSMNAKELAELVGFDSFRPLVGIFRYLNKETPKAPKAPKKPKFIIKTAKNTFKNYYGSGKDKARDLIAESIMLTKRQSSNILTLPADTWIMEKNILKKKSGYKFTAVERDKETYLKMVKNMVDNPILSESVIDMANKSIGEVIVNNGEDTYSSAILDYCGFIDSFYQEIDDVMKRNLIKKGGYITITLAENDRTLNNSNYTNSYSNTYIKNCCVDEEINGAKVTNDLINFLVYNNVGYKIVKKFKYRDKKVNMLLFIIKRIDE